MSGWRSSYRWQMLRKSVIEAYECCQKCGSQTNLEAHHRIPIKFGGEIWDLDNLIVLCKRCHLRGDAHSKKPKTSERRKWQTYIQKRIDGESV